MILPLFFEATKENVAQYYFTEGTEYVCNGQVIGKVLITRWIDDKIYYLLDKRGVMTEDGIRWEPSMKDKESEEEKRR